MKELNHRGVRELLARDSLVAGDFELGRGSTPTSAERKPAASLAPPRSTPDQSLEPARSHANKGIMRSVLPAIGQEESAASIVQDGGPSLPPRHPLPLAGVGWLNGSAVGHDSHHHRTHELLAAIHPRAVVMNWHRSQSRKDVQRLPRPKSPQW